MSKIRVRITLDTSDSAQYLTYIFLDKLARHKAIAISSIVSQFLKNNGITLEELERLDKEDLLEIIKDNYIDKENINQLVKANISVASTLSNALNDLINGKYQIPVQNISSANIEGSPPGTSEQISSSSKDSNNTLLEAKNKNEDVFVKPVESPPGTSSIIEELDENIMNSLEGNFDID